MATSNRDVELTLRVATLGQEGIRALEQNVRNLATQGGAAAPQFQALADEIGRLGDAASNLDSFSRLSQDVSSLTAAQNANAEVASILYGELLKLREATEAYEQSESKARETLQAAKRDLADKEAELRLLRITTDAAGKSSDDYKTKVQALRLEIENSKGQVRDLKDQLDQARVATNAAGAAESELEKRYSAANRTAQQSAQILRDRNETLIETRGTLAQAGVATDDLATSSIVLVDALNRAGTAAQNLVEDESRAAAAARALADEEVYQAAIIAHSRQQMAAAAKAEADGIIRDFDRMKQAEAEAAAQAELSAKAMDTAFRTTGTRSVQAITDEIGRVQQAMIFLAESSNVTGHDIDNAMLQGQKRIAALELELRGATGQLTLMDRASAALSSTLGQLVTGFGLVTIVQQLGSAFFDTNKKADSLRLGLNAVYKDTAVTASQIDFLRKVANDAGISISDIQEEFVKFSASTKSANIPLAQTNALFAAVVKAAGTLGLAGTDVSRILNALGQMASKGVVSMEELRQQLGDSLPGALSLMARGLGITESQLTKLITAGNLATRDAFPALTKALESMGGDIDTISSAWERFKNEFTIVAQAAGDSGWSDVLKGGLIGIGAALKPPLGLLVTLSEYIFLTVRASAAFAAALTSGGGLQAALKAAADEADATNARVLKFQQTLFGGADAAKQAADGHMQLGQAYTASGQAAQSGAVGVQANTTAAVQNAAAVAQMDLAHNSAGQAIDKASATALLAGKSWVQLSALYADNAKQLQNAVEVATKAVKAREVEGASVEALSKLRGDERGALEAGTKAAEGNLQALQNLQKARETELAAAQRYVDQLKSVILLQGDPDGSRARQLQDIQRHIDLLTAETDRTRAQVDSERVAVAQKQVMRQAYEDNSSAVDRLRTAMVLSQQVLKETQILEINGKASKDQVTAATVEAAKATALYNDALADYARRVAQQIEADKVAATITQGKLAIEAERAKSLAALAKLTGDEALATYANIKAKEVERDQRLANAQAIALEAQRSIEKALADRAELEATGRLTADKAREIDLRIQAAEAKKLEADRLRESVKTIEDEIIALRNGTEARNGSTNAIDRESLALAKNNELRKEANQITADGFKSNGDGSAAGSFDNNLPVDQAFKLASSGGSGFTLEAAKAAFAQAQAAFDDMQAFMRLSPGAASPEYIQSTTALYNAARAALQKIQASTIGTQPNTIPRIGSGSSTPAPAPAPSTDSTSHTVTINIGGLSQTISLASASDASALTMLLQQLSNASRTST